MRYSQADLIKWDVLRQLASPMIDMNFLVLRSRTPQQGVRVIEALPEQDIPGFVGARLECRPPLLWILKGVFRWD